MLQKWMNLQAKIKQEITMNDISKSLFYFIIISQ